MAARSHGVDFRNCVRSNFRRELHRLSGAKREDEPGLSESKHSLLGSQNRGVHGFAETNTGFFPISELHEGLLQRSHGSRSGQFRSNGGGGAFLIAHPGCLFACVRVDTCHPWHCMHSTSTHHPCTSSLANT
jgi:hypothetical protein